MTYANEAHKQAMERPLGGGNVYLHVRDELPITLLDEPRWTWRTRAWLVAALVAVWLVVVYVPWPRLAWMLGSL